MEEAWRMLEVLLVFRFEETWTRPSDDEKKPEGGKTWTRRRRANESLIKHVSGRQWSQFSVCGDTGREATILQDLREEGYGYR